MAAKRVSDVSAWIIGAAVSISVAAFGIYINSAPIISVSCIKCEASHGGSCVRTTATEDINLWGMIQKHHWELSGIYLTLFLAGVYAVVLIVQRFLVLYYAGKQSREFEAKAGEAMFRGELARAVRLAGDYPVSPLAFVINAAFAKYEFAGTRRLSMRSRHQAIVSKTIELRRGLWHLSAIGWLLALLALLAFCGGAINVGRMMRYTEAFYGPYIAAALTDSLAVMVYCVLAGFVILVAHRFFAARVEHFQLEMDRLSLAFIEGATSATESAADDCNQFGGDRYDDSRITGKLRAPARSYDWNIVGDGWGDSSAR
jgi:hypothetical protein